MTLLEHIPTDRWITARELAVLHPTMTSRHIANHIRAKFIQIPIPLVETKIEWPTNFYRRILRE